MRRLAKVIAALVLLVPVLAVGGYLVLVERLAAPGPLAADVTVVIPRGSGSEAMAVLLAEARVVESPLLFLAGRWLESKRLEIVQPSLIQGSLKAGEYAFSAHISIFGVLELLREGRTVVHRLTVPEGLTSHQIVDLVTGEAALNGPAGAVPPEGTLLPETYHFSRGDSRSQLLERMRKSMAGELADAWGKRAEGLPLTAPAQAVVLASIVEKETGIAAERPRIAGVFYNRLRLGMKLQSDPTTIYALTQGKGDLGRSLTHADLKTASPYNTYFADGLPPGPIANPGRAALEAVFHPEKHEFLYFVADGSGGHAFAKTLAEHNRNVQRWRESRQQ